ncbi:S-adenosyl-L-methionine-dependent methyltransferase [Sordaria brevicollis]|uniref:S-adenosyl-L-methionine-dependent methyltransferase n=1 Tax=Sordaria brevicollis TaxID=83679 RepID=A0AAE0PIT5_SORBR|nr:S-adenosyl-L-methionine-dependent methyltransferase [Sordaria brevicollis]
MSTPAPKSPTPAPKSPTPAPKSPTPGPASPAVGTAVPLPGSHWAEQGLPEEEEDDTDSTLGSDFESSTASISSTILQYRTINGRTYHSDNVTDGSYWGPNDEKANEMLDIFHHALTLSLDGRLCDAPLPDNIENVIDLGTGTGLWAIDFGDKFPNCNVVGTDISPIQPSWVPPNVRFDIDDYNKPWTYKDNHFDFIHLRWINGTSKDWSALYREAFRCCKPGGFIEHMDVSGTVSSDDGTVDSKIHAVAQWGPMWHAAGRKIGQVFLDDSTMIEDGLKDAGFVNINVKDYKIPLSPWSDDKKMHELGLYFYVALTQDLEGVLQYMWGTVMGWTDEEISIYIKHFVKELKDKTIHPYFTYRRVYAQKPLDA